MLNLWRSHCHYKLGASIVSPVEIADSLTVCSALTDPKGSLPQKTFISLVPPHLTEVYLILVPGHAVISLNEAADSLARIGLSGQIVEANQSTALITAARHRGMLNCQGQKESVLLSLADFQNLKFT